MATVLKNVLRFTGLVIGVPSVQAHGCNYNGRAVPPKNVWLNGGGFTVAVDDTNVTITRTASGSAAVDVAVELWHSYEDAEPLPSGIPASVMPFIMQGVGGGGGGGGAGVQIAAGTQTAATGTVGFTNSNGISFGMAGSAQVTAAFDAVKSFVASTNTASGPAIVLQNGNGVTFGIIGNTITASVQTVGGTATGVGISAGTEVATTGAVVFSNSNGFSFGMNASTVTLSGDYVRGSQRVVGFTATGGETDFSVTMAALPATNYDVFPALAGVSRMPILDCPKNSNDRALTAFRVIPSGSLVAGDQLAFLVYRT